MICIKDFKMNRRELLKLMATTIIAGKEKDMLLADKSKNDYPHIILVSFDTMRPDHLACYGYSKELAPNLDRLAEEGVKFNDHVANCGWTLPQHMSLLTGMYPLTHGMIRLRDNPPLRPEKTLMTKCLKDAGYLNFGVVNSNSYGGGRRYGFDRGFDLYRDDLPGNQHMEQTADRAISCLRDNHESGPCFLYIHVNDTHQPFKPPEPFFSQWGDSEHSHYEGEFTYVDYHFGRIIDELDRLNIREKTMVVVVSDHGYEFHEHGFVEKKVNLYNEIIDTVLLISYPDRLPKGKAIDGLVEMVDIAPTILDIAGLPPKSDVQGKSLLPWITGEASGAPKEIAYSHTFHNKQGQDSEQSQYEHFSARTAQYKFIRSHVLCEPEEFCADWEDRFRGILKRTGEDPESLHKGMVIKELYSLVDDPGEQRSILSEKPEIASDLEAKLNVWVEDTQDETSINLRRGIF